MIVVDTNVIAYLVMRGELTEVVEQVFQRDSEWGAPLLWRLELRNILVLKMRKKELGLTDAVLLFDLAREVINNREYEVASERVLAEAARTGLTAYDSEFLCLAEELRAPLLTTDRQIIGAAPSVAFHPRAFAER